MSFTGFGVVAGAELTDAVRRAGADHVEPSIAGNLVVRDGPGWALAGSYSGQRFPSFAVLVPGDLPLLTGEPGTVRQYFESVLPLVHSVADPGATIVFGSGTARRVPEGMPTDEGRRRFAEVVRTARDVAAEHDLRVVVEPLSRAETNLLHTVAETVAFLDDAGIDGVGVVADLFHIRNEGEPLEVVGAYGHRIGHVHLSDPDRQPPGTVDDVWRTFLDIVHEGGYGGSVSLECRWSPDVDDAEVQIRSALGRVRDAGGILVS
ncbi:Sugar phosphate isomerase/epimerase [Curtobacterium sp. UNCCL20]|uniref:sugar phosphate isomerase/epimerase family protein n=1 Tax=Curtobacterium sp. UNCCL20 TaxID=1502773 RepID=UPI000882D6A6|nr:sugar phosphate isomerase/epimerase family protein [Curtobacterium sp. UNCCL20]SDQ32983.1 Sugar phosphate isomerase/epimerase [Curtobacterium sp. UNCCL20]